MGEAIGPLASTCATAASMSAMRKAWFRAGGGSLGIGDVTAPSMPVLCPFGQPGRAPLARLHGHERTHADPVAAAFRALIVEALGAQTAPLAG